MGHYASEMGLLIDEDAVDRCRDAYNHLLKARRLVSKRDNPEARMRLEEAMMWLEHTPHFKEEGIGKVRIGE